jgi:hypothetical protein
MSTAIEGVVDVRRSGCFELFTFLTEILPTRHCIH